MPDDSAREKEVAFYAACVSAWIDTRMERDKSLLTLSAAGIGLLLTLASTTTLRPAWTLWLYAGALAGFLLCLVTCVVVFEKNAGFLQTLIKDGNSSDLARLTRMDALATWSFGTAIIFSVILGVVAAIHSQTAGVAL